MKVSAAIRASGLPGAASGEQTVEVGRATADGALPVARPTAGGAYEGAERFKNLANWQPNIQAPNLEIVPEKPTMDARARDLSRNDGGIAGGIALFKDHIVGQQFILNAKPRSVVLFGREDEAWELAFAEEVEAKFTLWAEGHQHWPDAQRISGLTGLVRLALSSYALGGEVLAAAEWMPDDGRPYRTAMQMVDPDRLCNPNGNEWKPNVVGGVERDRRGAPIAYHILNQHPSDWTRRGSPLERRWVRVMARKPNWGRANILHIFERQRPDQARGVSSLVSALSEIRMLQQFRRVELQRAVVAATYATSIESDMPAGDLWTAMGADEANPALDYAADYLEGVRDYNESAKNLRMDGVKIPLLFPGSRLRVQSTGTSSPLGAEFETSMLRHIAAALGVSYEQLSRDFSKTNYSSGRAAMGETERHLASIKKTVADDTASFVYRLWLEEAINYGHIETLRRPNVPNFYDALNADAYTVCEWIGAGRGQVDELKETQAAGLRLRLGLSTHETEIARVGSSDWRTVLKQRVREKKAYEDAGLPSVFDTEPSAAENAATGEPREVSE